MEKVQAARRGLKRYCACYDEIMNILFAWSCFHHPGDLQFFPLFTECFRYAASIIPVTSGDLRPYMTYLTNYHHNCYCHVLLLPDILSSSETIIL